MYKLVILIFISSLFLRAEDDINTTKWLPPLEIPQPTDNRLTTQRIKLGKLLFFDKRLSSDDSISCATCHHPKRGWTDFKPVSKAVGVHGRIGPRNSPTLLNTAYQNRQFWDGRVRTLEQQALGPIQTDVEMDMPLEVLVVKLKAIKTYATLFEEAYPNEKLDKTTIAKALASFERTIISPPAPFDRYVQGDKKAISQDAKEGFKLFKHKAHCTDCHDGFNFTDGSFHNIGLKDGELTGKELGRYNVKSRVSWYGVMKTPTLRDITKSYPYFHDGSVQTLEEATEICSKGGRYNKNVKNKSHSMKDRNLTKEERRKIVVFMKTLTSPDIDIIIPTKFP